MARDPAQRPRTALELAALLEAAVALASPREVGAWVSEVAAELLGARERRIREIEAAGIQKERPSVRNLFGLAQPKTVPLIRPQGLERITYDTSSQVSSVGMATPIMAIPIRARRTWPWMFAVAALILAGMGAVIARRSTTSAPPAASATEPSGAASTPPPPSETPPPDPAQAPVPSGSAAGTPPPPPASVSTARPSKRPPPAKSPPAAKRCNPPYTVDEDGIHIPKPECE
jgi:serine/threonine-protein kinase